MNSSALTIMILAQGFFTFFAAYYFYKVMTIPPKSDSDPHPGNDDGSEGQND